MNKEEQVEIRTAIIQGNLEELSRLVKPYNINAPMQLCGLWLHNNYGTYGIFSRVCQVHGNQYNWDFRYPSEKKN
jgi:heme/copper-type cytochrome/quinol oxidase subunit 2